MAKTINLLQFQEKIENLGAHPRAPYTYKDKNFQVYFSPDMTSKTFLCLDIEELTRTDAEMHLKDLKLSSQIKISDFT